MLACPSCGFESWFTNSELTPEERRDIEGLIEARRGPKTVLPPPKIKKVINFNTPHRTKERKVKHEIPRPKKPPSKAPKSKENIVLKSPQEVSLHGHLDKIFKVKLRNHLNKYAERPAQIKLAKTIGSSFINNTILVAEAGVGTGKSFAYLFPVSQHFITDGPILISTKTINLQEQLISKDIPFIKRFNHGMKTLLVKGQSHFLCNARYSKAKFPIDTPPDLLKDLEKWVEETNTGDRSDAPPVPNNIWDLINVEDCDGKDCHLFSTEYCGLIKYKEKRKQFNGILVCNHNLLIDDLLLRSSNGITFLFGKRISTGLWPSPKAIIIDEAHGLVDSCRQELSQEISVSFIEKVLKKIFKNRRIASAVESMSDEKVADTLFAELERFQNMVDQYGEKSSKDEYNRFLVPNTMEVIEQGISIIKALKNLETQLDIAQAYSRLGEKESATIDRITYKVKTIYGKIQKWVQNPEDYYLAAKKNRGDTIFTVAPINVSGFLQKNLWELNIPTIITSGTLSTDEKFEHIKSAIGLSENLRVREYIGHTTLGDNANVAYYLPSDLPVPRPDSDEFTISAASRIADMVKITQGRALILFTSYHRLYKVYDILSQRKDIPWTVLKQGGAGVKHLLERFRDEETSILLATGSFWEGVDVVGPSLSMVVMDKLPFPAPNDPLTKARVRQEKAFGRNPLETVYIPEMLLRLKQGAGRLLRNEDDWGIISILDNRARSRYSDLVKKTLPLGVEYKNLNELTNWYNQRLHKVTNSVF